MNELTMNSSAVTQGDEPLGSIPPRPDGGFLSHLPPFNFISLHYAYFITTCLVASVIFWASSSPQGSISYIDSLFLVISGMTEAGLNTVNLSQMTAWQQAMLFMLIIVGSSVWVSIWTVVVRIRAFESRFQHVVAAERRRDRERRDMDTLGPPHREHGSRPRAASGPKAADVAVAVVGAEPLLASPQAELAPDENKPTRTMPLHWTVALGESHAGPNGQFHSLSRAERDRLGGCEYRALKVLAVLVSAYWFVFQLLGSLAIGSFVAASFSQNAAKNKVNPWWAGAFFAVSAFNNSGMAPFDENAIAFERHTGIPCIMACLILAGNTAFPVLLRFQVWSILKLLNAATRPDALSPWKETLEFILMYPRRVYTHLFPARQTWWLFSTVFLLNVIDTLAFLLMNIGNPVVEAIPTGYRIMDAIFQAAAVRSGGFYIVPVGKLYMGVQVLYVIMMYINVFPVVITLRRSNVYEERSLGRYADAPPHDPESTLHLRQHQHPHPHAGLKRATTRTLSSTIRRAPSRVLLHKAGAALRHILAFNGVGAARTIAATERASEAESPVAFVATQVRGQISHDVWLLALAVLAITTLETARILGDPVSWSVFNIIFEVVSAYGCVGISVGVPFDSFSFSGGWGSPSKLVLCLVMLRGRHRGLPVAIDRAVRLPSERLETEEEEDNVIRMERARKE